MIGSKQLPTNYGIFSCQYKGDFMQAIQTQNLTKTFKRLEKDEGFKGTFKTLFKRSLVEKTALSSFDLTIEKGELLGLIGPNGAGKTTLIKLLCGIIQPTSGELSVLGYIPGKLKDDFRRKYAVVMGQKSQLWWDLPASDTFLLNKEIYGIDEATYRKNVNEYIEMFDVKDLVNVPVRNLSLGERMKMELIAALLHNPELVFLDEPTIGLDAIAQKQIRNFLRDINNDRKVTILLTSHYMEDIRNLCERTVVINDGCKIYDGHLDELLRRYQMHRIIHVTFSEAGSSELIPGAACRILDAEWIERSPYKGILKVPRENTKELLKVLLTECDVDDVRIEDEEIGGVVERIYMAGKGGSSI
jgi:ABC-2 type transport system ATP-binding protein